MGDINKNIGNGLKVLAKSSIIVFIGLAISKVLAYIYRIMIARAYGPEAYGMFNLSVMVVGLFVTISSLGLSDGLVRYISMFYAKKKNKDARYLFQVSLLIVSIGSIISALAVYLLADFISISIFHNLRLIIFLKIFAVAIPCTSLMSLFLAVLRSKELIGWYSFIFNILQTFVRTALLGFFVLLGLSNKSVSLSYSVGMILVVILTYFITKRYVADIFVKASLDKDKGKRILKDVLNYSIPLTFNGLLITLFFWVDSFSLGYYKTVYEVGIYGAATAIAMLLNLAPEMFSQLFFPLITKEYSKGNIGLIQELSKQVGKWIFIVSLPISILIVLFPGAAINVLQFGKEFLPAKDALRILAIAALIANMGFVSSQLLSIIGKSKLVLLNSFIAVVVNLIFNSLLVPMPKIWFIDNASGINGAAIATLLSVIIFNGLFVIQTYKHSKIIPFRRKMIRIFLIALIPAMLLYYLRRFVIIKGIISLGLMTLAFLVVYFVLIILFKCLDKNDYLIINRIYDKTNINFIRRPLLIL